MKSKFHPEEQELRRYLGERYDRRRLERHERELDDEYRRVADDARFYRVSERYLYDLTVFAMSGTKLPYLRDIRRAFPPGSRLLDYGCGIGSDGLALMEAGYDVSFADFANPSTRYLRWRLDLRGLAAAVYDLDRDEIPDGFDLVYSFDVIEHVADPFAFLARLEACARTVMVNFLAPKPDDVALHHDLPIAPLLRYCARQRLLRYRRYHGRSHLVLYKPHSYTGPAAVRSRVALWTGCILSTID